MNDKLEKRFREATTSISFFVALIGGMYWLDSIFDHFKWNVLSSVVSVVWICIFVIAIYTTHEAHEKELRQKDAEIYELKKDVETYTRIIDNHILKNKSSSEVKNSEGQQ